MYPDMAQYDQSEVKIGPAGCTHCSHFLAMLLDERPCNAQGISEFGRMSHRICFKDPGIKRAATEGMEWTVYKWQVEEAFPEIPGLIASALNAVSQIGEGHDWFAWVRIVCRFERVVSGGWGLENGDVGQFRQHW